MKNNLNSSIFVLIKPDLQPSFLLLKKNNDETIKPFDQRLRRKFDKTVYKNSWDQVAPNQTISLGTAVFSKNSNGHYEMTWGPYLFNHLIKGTYQIQIEWDSQRKDWTDRKTGGTGCFDNVIQGNFFSNTVEIELR